MKKLGVKKMGETKKKKGRALAIAEIEAEKPLFNKPKTLAEAREKFNNHSRGYEDEQEFEYSEPEVYAELRGYIKELSV